MLMKSQLNFENIEFKVKSETTASGVCMEVISFSKPLWLSESKFGVITRNTENEELPQFERYFI